jgi:acyl-CoA thioesterase I
MQLRTWSNNGRNARRACSAILLPIVLAACSQDAGQGDAIREARGDSASEASEAPAIPVMGPEVRILAFGNSLFAGYGLDAGESYPSRLEAALRARGVNAKVANAGVSGDTSAAGLQRLSFVLDAQEKKPDLFILELGGNDLLRQISPRETRQNLAAILDELKSRNIPAVIFGMRAPPNYGPEYQAQFDELYADLAREYGAGLVPFWVEPIFADPVLLQSDRIHPTARGIEELVASTVSNVAAAVPQKVAESAQ